MSEGAFVSLAYWRQCAMSRIRSLRRRPLAPFPETMVAWQWPVCVLCVGDSLDACATFVYTEGDCHDSEFDHASGNGTRVESM